MVFETNILLITKKLRNDARNKFESTNKLWLPSRFKIEYCILIPFLAYKPFKKRRPLYFSNLRGVRRCYTDASLLSLVLPSQQKRRAKSKVNFTILFLIEVKRLKNCLSCLKKKRKKEKEVKKSNINAKHRIYTLLYRFCTILVTIATSTIFFLLH